MVLNGGLTKFQRKEKKKTKKTYYLLWLPMRSFEVYHHFLHALGALFLLLTFGASSALVFVEVPEILDCISVRESTYIYTYSTDLMNYQIPKNQTKISRFNHFKIISSLYLFEIFSLFSFYDDFHLGTLRNHKHGCFIDNHALLK